MFRKPRRWIGAFVLAGIAVCGFGGVTGCAARSSDIVTNTSNVAEPHQGGYKQFKPARYVSAQSLTKKWMQVDGKTHSLTVFLSLSANNLSLNGYYHGFAAIEVPVGWKVKLSFQDQNPDISGKLAVVDSRNNSSSTVTPAFSGAITPNVSVDNSSTPTTIQFTPTKAGAYVVEFVPTAQAGSWLWLVVDSTSTTPQVKIRK